MLTVYLPGAWIHIQALDNTINLLLEGISAAPAPPPKAVLAQFTALALPVQLAAAMQCNAIQIQMKYKQLTWCQGILSPVSDVQYPLSCWVCWK